MRKRWFEKVYPPPPAFARFTEPKPAPVPKKPALKIPRLDDRAFRKGLERADLAVAKFNISTNRALQKLR